MRFSWHFILLKLLPVFGIIFGVISLLEKSSSQWLPPHVVTSLYFLSLLCLLPLLFYSVYNIFKKSSIQSQAFITLLLLFLLALILDYIFDTHFFAKRKFIREDILYLLLFIPLLSFLLIKFEHKISLLYSKILSIFNKRVIAFCLIFISVTPFAYNFLYNLYLDPFELFNKRYIGVYAPYDIRNAIERISHGGYDAIIVGSSPEIGIKNEVFDKLLGKKYNFTHSVSLLYGSITDYTEIRFMKMALVNNPKMKLVYFGYLVHGDYIGSYGSEESKYSYLFDDNKFNDLRFFYESRPQDLSELLKSRYNSTVVQDWMFPYQTKFSFNMALSGFIYWCREVSCYKLDNIDENLTEEQKNNINEYVSELDEVLLNYPNTKFVLYIPLWYHLLPADESLQYRYNLIKKILMLKRKNIQIFMPRSDYILEYPEVFYADYFHPHPYIHTLYLKLLRDDKFLVNNIDDVRDYYSWYKAKLDNLNKQFPDRLNYEKFESYYDNHTPLFNSSAVTVWNLQNENKLFIRIKNCNYTVINSYSFALEVNDSIDKKFRFYRDSYHLFAGLYSNAFVKGDSCYIEQGLPYKDWTEHYTASSVRINLKYHDIYLLHDVVLNLTPTTWRPPAPIQEIIDKKEDYIVLKSDFDKYLIKK